MNLIRPKSTQEIAALFKKATGGRTSTIYSPGEQIYGQGDSATTVYFIEHGSVKVSVVAVSGKEAVLTIFGSGDFFGEQSLMAGETRTTTATAIKESSILRIDATALARVLHEDKNFSEYFIRCLVDRKSRTEDDLIDQLFNSSEKRLARALLIMAHFGEEGEPEATIPQIDQTTLADMIGTTRPRVNYFMNKFRRLGFIEYNGGITVRKTLLSVLLEDGRPHTKGR